MYTLCLNFRHARVSVATGDAIQINASATFLFEIAHVSRLFELYEFTLSDLSFF